jgi:hypothetical protein
MNKPCCKFVLVPFLIALLLGGCASFNKNYLAAPKNKPDKDAMRHVKMVYVQEGQKPQDDGKMCYEFHGCLWHGRNTFGQVLTQNFLDLGVNSTFMGLSRLQRAYTRTATSDAVKKKTLGPEEYIANAQVRYISDGPGIWFLKSLLGGFTLTTLPIWQTITTDVEVTLTDHNQDVVWKNRYTDSYTGMAWLLMLPMVSTASSTPDAITDKIARTAINDMVESGIFIR